MGRERPVLEVFSFQETKHKAVVNSATEKGLVHLSRLSRVVPML